MKKYKIKVETPGKLLFYKNRKIRSPFTIDINEDGLELFKSTMISSGIDTYGFEEIKKEDKVDDEWEIAIVEDKDVVIEDLYEDDEEDPSTLLGKLLRNEKKNGE